MLMWIKIFYFSYFSEPWPVVSRAAGGRECEQVTLICHFHAEKETDSKEHFVLLQFVPSVP
jgi:hypothetical protein